MTLNEPHFHNFKLIGQGAYGTVYKAFWPARNSDVALKKVQLEVEGEGVPPSALREISLLKEVDHPCVVKLLDIHYNISSNDLILVFEFVNQDLRKFLQERQDHLLPAATVRSFMFQLIAAVAHCHSNRILHRDLKPDNVLVDQHGRLKVADFGLARVFTTAHRKYTNGVVTLWYRPPELLLGAEHYYSAVDVWSIACIMSELVTLNTLFRCQTEIEMLFRIFFLMGTPTEAMWPGVRQLPNFNRLFPHWEQQQPVYKLVPGLDAQGVDLFSRMLQCSPTRRILCSQALMHPYFDQIDEDMRSLADI